MGNGNHLVFHRGSRERIGIDIVQPRDRRAAAAVGSRESGTVGAECDPIVGSRGRGGIGTEYQARCEPAGRHRHAEPRTSHRSCLTVPVTTVELLPNGSALPPLATGRIDTEKMRSCSPANGIAELV